MKAGFAQAQINPPLGMALEGLGQPHGAESIHDDLIVRSLYLEHASQKVLLIGYDLLFFEEADINLYKAAITRQSGLSAAQILINTSHNHAGPRMTHWAYSDGPDRAYLDRVLAATLETVRKAQASPQEVSIAAGMAHNRIPVSRRRPDGTGKIQWGAYLEGEICDALPFFLLRDKNDRVVSLVFSVSCHPSMMYDCIFSAEYPGAAMRQLNEHFQTQGALFLQGMGGDTKPRQIVNEAEKCFGHGTWEQMEDVGAEITQAIVKQVKTGLTPIEPDLRIHMAKVDWPLQKAPSRSDLEAVLADAKDRPARHLWAKDMLAQLERGPLSKAAKVGLHAIQIGKGLRMIGLEGEAVGEIGNFILKIYDKGITFPMGYTDGCQLYLPVTRMLPEDGYEVDSYWEYHYPARLAAGGEVVLKKPLEDLQTSGKIPG